MSVKNIGLVALTAIAFVGSTVLADARPGQGGRGGAAPHFSSGGSSFSGSRSSFSGSRMSGSQFSGARMSTGSARYGNYSGNYNRSYSYNRRGRGWGGYGVGLGVATGLALGAGYGYGYGYDPYYTSYGYDDGYYGNGYAAYGSGECWIQRRAVIDQFGYRQIRRVQVCE
jgi:hypothetical protein